MLLSRPQLPTNKNFNPKIGDQQLVTQLKTKRTNLKYQLLIYKTKQPFSIKKYFLFIRQLLIKYFKTYKPYVQNSSTPS
ncbi:hypothetical protein BpHYR1_037329 [Brachionus plicatilis]|uniref:Uncharacterized protein n=1 Tax=Brachionus plicatilis TaxID=10195 RepID=A0A3M7RTC6_BRAPC|nr:hypothetical protein BpHYR1_037329 [Brachionus plicatilis]